MTKFARLILLGTIAAIAQPVAAAEPLGTAGNIIGTVLGIGTAIGKKGAPNGIDKATAAYVTRISPAQEKVIQDDLTALKLDADAARDLTEARPIIEQVIRVQSCATDPRAFLQFNKISMNPRNWQGDYPDTLNTPLRNWRYHDSAQCATVQKTGDWKKPSINTLSFGVRYISDQSGEVSKIHRFTLQKGLDGAWLIRSWTS